MKIGYDAKRAAQNGTGLGNYSRFIIRSVYQWLDNQAMETGMTDTKEGETGEKNKEICLYCPRPDRVEFLSQLPSDIRKIFPGKAWSFFPSLWRVWGISRDLKRDGISLFHGLSNELPLNIARFPEIRTVVTVHDLISVRFPQFFPWIDARIYAYKIRQACQSATRVIAVSQRTKEDIVELFGTDPAKIDVVYQGCHAQFQQEVPMTKMEEIKRKYDLPDRFIFHLGSLEERKNLMLMAQALEYLPEDYTLVAIGRRTPYSDKVMEFAREHHLDHRTRLFHKIPFSDLPAFYHLSRVFVYPSRYEGFGIPLLEALFCKIPVIGATGSCLEEAGGPDSLYIHPDDAQGLALAIEQTWNNEELRQKMISNGYAYAQNFKDEVLIGKLLETYRKALS